MSNIIQPGRYPEENKVTCDQCKCYFEFYTTEIHTDMTTPDEQALFGGFGIHRWIECPECKHKITLSSEFKEDIPFEGITRLINKIKYKFKRKKD